MGQLTGMGGDGVVTCIVTGTGMGLEETGWAAIALHSHSLGGDTDKSNIHPVQFSNDNVTDRV